MRLAEQCLHNLPSRCPPIAEVLERLEAVGESVRDQYSLLNKLEMVKLHEREMAPLRRMQTQLQEKQQQLQSVQQDHDALLQDFEDQLKQKEGELRQTMQLGHEVELSRVNQHREAELSRKDHQLQSMQQGHEAELRRMDEVHRRVAIGRQQWRHQEEQEWQQQQLASLKAELRRIKPQVSPW